jgi:hypothetical protein
MAPTFMQIPESLKMVCMEILPLPSMDYYSTITRPLFAKDQLGQATNQGQTLEACHQHTAQNWEDIV